MPSTFAIQAPDDFVLARDYCSYGYFLLRPNHWDVKHGVFTRGFSFEKSAFAVQVSQKGPGGKLTIRSTRPITAKARALVETGLTRMLRLDESADHIAEFHALDPRWKQAGRGRLMRSPTMFEDVIKTVTSCNVTWPSTVQMNRRLCEVLGDGGVEAPTFPGAAKIARTRPQTLRARCRVGYRDARIIELAKMFRTGAIDPAWYEDPATPDEDVYDALVDLPGIGPYAAANIMQLLGRYARLPLDTESVRHGKSVLNYDGSSAEIMKKLKAHYEPFGRHAFRSYWFELWDFYESKHGPAHTWERETTGTLFTAAKLKK